MTSRADDLEQLADSCARLTAALIHEDLLRDSAEARKKFDELRANDPKQAQAVAFALAGGAR